MCCSVGGVRPVRGPALIDVREDLRWAESQGAQVARHNLSSDPDAFVANPKVTGLMAAFGEPRAARACSSTARSSSTAATRRGRSSPELLDLVGESAVSTRKSWWLRLRLDRLLLMSLPDPTSLPALTGRAGIPATCSSPAKAGSGRRRPPARSRSPSLTRAGARWSSPPTRRPTSTTCSASSPARSRRAVPGVDGLFVSNLDPEAAAAAFKERAVGPYRGVLPDVGDCQHGRAAVGRVHGRDCRVQRVHRRSGRSAADGASLTTSSSTPPRPVTRCGC